MNPMGIAQMLSQNPQILNDSFRKFRQSVPGNPQEMVMAMLQTGKINQQQLNFAQNLASQLQNILK